MLVCHAARAGLRCALLKRVQILRENCLSGASMVLQRWGVCPDRLSA